LDKIPLEEQRVIDGLVGLWQTHYEPRNLITHLDRLSGSWGSGIGASFFRQVYEDLRTNKRGKYTASSASEFKRFLEAEYRQLAKPHTERQAQAIAEYREWYERRAKAHEEYVRMARAEFDALGKQMAKATSRAELIELGRKRADLALHTCDSYDYENVCWCCGGRISSGIHAQCKFCKYFICGSCGSCLCNRTYTPVQDKAVNPFLDMPDDFIL
jgi:hypothetical protein